MFHQVTRRELLTAAASGTLGLVVGRSAESAGSDSLRELDRYCQEALATWQVPGMAIAVIRDGKLLLARGYGVRELGKKEAVDENSVFSIASCTKSFTAAMVGKLVDQGKLAWEDPLARFIPQLNRPDGDPAPTLRHALQHRTGFPAANMLWRSGEFDSGEILRRTAFLKPVAGPGEKILYSNVMYLVAAKAAESACGKSWSDFVDQELFAPLGMQSSTTGSSRLKALGNVAAPHATVDGRVRVIPRYCPESVAPAGAIHSTAADMARWLVLHLNRGKNGERVLLSAARIDEMHAPAISPSEPRAEKAVPKAPISQYGMGWFTNEFGGKRVVEHSGTQNGLVSWMSIMPAERLGVVILSNHHQTGINMALRSWIFDRLLGRPDYDWSSAVRGDYTRGCQRLLREAKTAFDEKRPRETPPSLPLMDYAGEYESRLYGRVRVALERGKLKLRFGTRFDGDLRSWDGDTCRAFFSNPRLDDWMVKFTVTDGKVAALAVQEAPWAPEWYDDRDDLGDFVRQ